MLEILLFLGYSLIIGIWILRSGFFDRFRLRRTFLLAIFLLKLAAGTAYGLIYEYFYATGDIIHYFADSKIIYNALWDEPLHFFQMLFGYSADGVVPPQLEYLDNQLRIRWRTPEYTMVRLNALFNIFSFGHYYVNVVFMSALSLIGLATLHEVFRRHAPNRGGILAFVIFLLPATLFWCSGMHKDTVTLCTIGLALYCTNGLAFRFTAKRLILLIGSLFLLAITRDYAFLLLLPNLLLYYSCLKFPGHAFRRFALMNLALFLIVTQVNRVIPGLDPLQKLVDEQTFLLNLKGNTHLEMRPIEPTLVGILQNLPQAFDHVWLKPVTHLPRHSLQWASAIDSLAQLLLLFFLMSRINWKTSQWDALSLCCLFFTAAVLLLVGLTVPALGAIVRYKSVMMPFLLAPFAARSRTDLPFFKAD